MERVKQVVPDIEERVRLIKAVEDIERASGFFKTGTYIRGALTGGAVLTGNVPAIIGAILAQPSIAVPLLKGAGYVGQKAAPILDALKNIANDVNNFSIPSSFKNNEGQLKMGASLEDISKVGKISDNLLTEARKYKSAETTLDRILSSGETPKVYRGTSDLQKGQIPKEGLSVSFDPSIAGSYAKSRGLGGYVDTIKISPKAKIIKLGDIPNSVRSAEEGSDFAGKAAIWARKNGYDILDMSNGNEAELRILNDNVILK